MCVSFDVMSIKSLTVFGNVFNVKVHMHVNISKGFSQHGKFVCMFRCNKNYPAYIIAVCSGYKAYNSVLCIVYCLKEQKYTML